MVYFRQRQNRTNLTQVRNQIWHYNIHCTMPHCQHHRLRLHCCLNLPQNRRLNRRRLNQQIRRLGHNNQQRRYVRHRERLCLSYRCRQR
jgi:predicted nucleotidyltransferase